VVPLERISIGPPEKAAQGDAGGNDGAGGLQGEGQWLAVGQAHVGGIGRVDWEEA
jgi:hypothetical protein